MYERVARIRERVNIDRYPICIEKFRITLDVKEKYKNEAVILQRARCLEGTATRMPIAIADDELSVGIGASKPMGLEIDPDYGIWSADEIESLKKDGFTIDPQDEVDLQRLNETFHPKTQMEEIGKILYDTERLNNFMRSGVVLPPWKPNRAGVGGGYAQSGPGLGPALTLLCVDYKKPLYQGFNAMIKEAEEEIEKLRYLSGDAIDRYRYYQAVIISLKAVITLAERYSKLAAEMAEKETDPKRRAELLQISETCAWVPANPARTFREAMQSFWFVFLMMNPCTTLPGGRFDQFMYPFYKADLEAGRITREEATELLCLLRLKDMEMNRTSGSNLRKKNAGMAKWHNFTIGGVDAVTGEDATNDLTYILLDAIEITNTPHHTVTLRVHKGTPMPLMVRAMQVVRLGLGMPAFIGDDSYIKTFTLRGMPIEDAREYVMSGCLDANLPGKSRTPSVPMTVLPLIFDIFRHRGMDVTTGLKAGKDCGDFTEFKSYEELWNAWKEELVYCLNLVGEQGNIKMRIQAEMVPDPLRSAMMFEGIKSGKDMLSRRLPFENCCVMNPIGMVNLGDSFAAIKKLVFEDKKYTLRQLADALDANWQGYEEMQRDFKKAPKFGNNDDYVDRIVADCYKLFVDIVETVPNVFGGHHIPTGISITSHQPGGALTGATPDGRFAKQILADGTMSPMQGNDVSGPLAVIQSAMKVDQDPFQATLLNMKFSPTALKTDEDLEKLANMTKIYLTHGGKHVQFNVVDRETLRRAQAEPEKNRDLVVRVAGYSTYFIKLSTDMQNEVINRSEHVL